MKVYGQIEKAQLELVTSDTPNLPKGMITYRSDLNIAKISNGTLMKMLIDEDSTQAMSNKTLNNPAILGYFAQDEIATPATPAAGLHRQYFKSDGNLYTLDSAGIERRVGSGQGVENYFPFGDAETGTTVGWAVAYNTTPSDTPEAVPGGAPNVNFTWTAQNSDKLNGNWSYTLTKDAANRQGHMVRTDVITLPQKLLNSKVYVNFVYKSSANYVTDDLKFFALNVTTGDVQEMATSSDGKRLFGTFFTDGNATYRFIIHQASASVLDYTVTFDDFVMNGSELLQASISEDHYTAYTPTLSSGTGTGAVVNTCQVKREGSDLLWEFRVTLGTGPTATAATVSLPPGLTVGGAPSTGGYIPRGKGSGNTIGFGVDCGSLGATSVSLRPDNNGAVLTWADFGAGQRVTFTARIPIAEWEGQSNILTTSQLISKPSGISVYGAAVTSIVNTDGIKQVTLDTIDVNLKYDPASFDFSGNVVTTKRNMRIRAEVFSYLTSQADATRFGVYLYVNGGQYGSGIATPGFATTTSAAFTRTIDAPAGTTFEIRVDYSGTAARNTNLAQLRLVEEPLQTVVGAVTSFDEGSITSSPQAIPVGNAIYMAMTGNSFNFKRGIYHIEFSHSYASGATLTELFPVYNIFSANGNNTATPPTSSAGLLTFISSTFGYGIYSGATDNRAITWTATVEVLQDFVGYFVPRVRSTVGGGSLTIIMKYQKIA